MATNNHFTINTQKRAVPRRFQIDWLLTLILIAALFLYGWQIWKAGSANAFYTAAIKSMTESFKNFWYGSFDPAGYITVDKPPVALWFMAISAKIFGVHGWSVVLPSVLFGVGSVYLMYRLVKPYFGKTAGRLSALAMTLTPIVVANSRTNNMDATLVFFLLLALLLLEKAIASQKLITLLGSFALIGVAFNVKMLQAFMILPAMYLFYWLAANEKWQQKVKKLTFATVSLLIFTLALPLSTDMTSASKRPYIGGSEHNSLIELAFGYNGTERLLGQTTGVGGTFGGGMNSKSQTKKGQQRPGQNKLPTTGKKGATPPTGTPGGKRTNGFPGGNGQKGGPTKMGNGGGGAFDIGTAGPLRIFQSSLGPQISWLLPFAIIGLIGGLVFYRDRKKRWYQLSHQQKQLVLWTGWLVPVYGFFSVASFFHPYYMIMLAPPIAALFGIGVTALFKLFTQNTRRNWRFYLLPLAILTTAGLQAWYVSSYYPWLMWLILAVATLIAGVMLFLPRNPAAKGLLVGGLITILVAPTWWSLTPTIAAKSAMIPTAGPSLLNSKGGSAMGGGMGGNSQVNTKLLNYLEKHQGNAKYLFATSDSTTAAPYIIKTGKAVMAMGGFNGTDPAITLKEFKQLVKSGQVKYYYSSGRSGNSAIVNWIKKHATKVKTSLYQNSSSQSATGSTASAKKAAGSRQPTGQKMPAFGNKAPNQKMPAKGKNAKGAKKPTAKGTKQVAKPSASRKNNSQLPGGMGGMGATGVLYDLSTIYQ
ncbi:putative mannosyltransferase YycA [Lentilactobacillus fungorum]|uniref:Mannosyltransferase YycA n=1 Tax=Lentilactobacillus fungorum TaxID=2201250 RepID=A0ABQ3W1C4_9LACO|nr:glycosyltransferase family 39 protein [Lentilactobacillus fungorum]GHP14980.1 putative mannosyltransferase YycA [Lentilactobacillus fungorum]